MKDIMELCDIVRETAFAIHCYHKYGHLEKVSRTLSRTAYGKPAGTLSSSIR